MTHAIEKLAQHSAQICRDIFGNSRAWSTDLESEVIHRIEDDSAPDASRIAALALASRFASSSSALWDCVLRVSNQSTVSGVLRSRVLRTLISFNKNLSIHQHEVDFFVDAVFHDRSAECPFDEAYLDFVSGTSQTEERLATLDNRLLSAIEDKWPDKLSQGLCRVLSKSHSPHARRKAAWWLIAMVAEQSTADSSSQLPPIVWEILKAESEDHHLQNYIVEGLFEFRDDLRIDFYRAIVGDSSLTVRVREEALQLGYRKDNTGIQEC